MAHPRTSFRNIITRGLALMVMLCIYGFGLIGASAVLLGASSAPAQARGGGRGGGFGGGGFRGGGIGGVVSGVVVSGVAVSVAEVSVEVGGVVAVSAVRELAWVSVSASPHPTIMADIPTATDIPAITTTDVMW